MRLEFYLIATLNCFPEVDLYPLSTFLVMTGYAVHTSLFVQRVMFIWFTVRENVLAFVAENSNPFMLLKKYK